MFFFILTPSFLRDVNHGTKVIGIAVPCDSLLSFTSSRKVPKYSSD